jgi:impB/mucB/samB family
VAAFGLDVAFVAGAEIPASEPSGQHRPNERVRMFRSVRQESGAGSIRSLAIPAPFADKVVRRPVGGGVVLAASYEAKSFGVSSRMSGWRARELCPQLILVGGHFEDYRRLGNAAIGISMRPLPGAPKADITRPGSIDPMSASGCSEAMRMPK